MTYDDVLAYGLTLADTISENHFGMASLKTDCRTSVDVGASPGRLC